MSAPGDDDAPAVVAPKPVAAPAPVQAKTTERKPANANRGAPRKVAQTDRDTTSENPAASGEPKEDRGEHFAHFSAPGRM